MSDTRFGAQFVIEREDAYGNIRTETTDGRHIHAIVGDRIKIVRVMIFDRDDPDCYSMLYRVSDKNLWTDVTLNG